MDTSTAPSWSLRLTSELDAADARATAIVGALTTHQLNWKPSADVWSVGQCLEHLCISNEVYMQPIADALRAMPTRPVNEITLGWISRWFIRRYIEPTSQKTRARAPRKAMPIGSRIDRSILERFIASNAKVRAVIAAAHSHDINRVRFRNPFVPGVRFTVGAGLQIIARHNHRHLLQAERVTQSPRFPRDES